MMTNCTVPSHRDEFGKHCTIDGNEACSITFDGWWAINCLKGYRLSEKEMCQMVWNYARQA